MLWTVLITISWVVTCARRRTIVLYASKILLPDNASAGQLLSQEGPDDEVIRTVFSISIKWRDMRTLRPGCWLNDEIINAFFDIIQHKLVERGRSDIALINTFFLPQLALGYSNVRRWLSKRVLKRKLGKDIGSVFELDKLMVPVLCNGMHWSLAVLCFTSKTISFFDSAIDGAHEWAGAMEAALILLLGWVQAEALDKLGHADHCGGWTTMTPTCPQRDPSCPGNCGVFVCAAAAFIANGLPLAYSHRNMRDFRVKIAETVSTVSCSSL
jgi:sentrin-specific protease 1